MHDNGNSRPRNPIATVASTARAAKPPREDTDELGPFAALVEAVADRVVARLLPMLANAADPDPVKPIVGDGSWQAEFGGKERAWIDRAKTGELKAYRVGGEERGVLVAKRSDVIAWLESKPAAPSKTVEADADAYLRIVGGSR